MRGHVSHLRLSAAILSMVLTVFFQAYADEGETSQQTLKPGMWIVESTPKISQTLRSLAAAPAETAAPSAAFTFQNQRFTNPKTSKLTEAGGMDSSVVQREAGGESMPAPTANFEGVNNVNGVLPPDSQGDIGFDPANSKKYYVQWVNLSFQIWDVTDPASPLSLVGPVAGNTLWSGFGGLCETHNDGDPLTRFDSISKRWVMSQWAINPPNNFHQCVAVSQTADPTGAWYRYDFPISSTVWNDYSKLGVWPDGYYMSFNQFDGVTSLFKGVGVAVFERAKMLSGQAARMIYIDVGAADPDYFGMLPSDLDGTPPPASSPNYFAEWDDSTTLGDTWDTLRLWAFHTDWSTPANSTFGVGPSHLPNIMIPTANVNPDMCGGERACIPQPGTVQKLDAISDRLMYRLQYRNFGTHQTLVGNRTVDADGSDRAGVYWFELRNTGAGFAMHQQGVYAPVDGQNRWVGSAAMDASGNIALGYSVSSTSIYPSIRYTGRLSGDPLGMLLQGENTLIAGGGSQTSSTARWGDYSMMAVDPADGCTFWYTQEYMQTTGNANWQTRIGSFRFPGCTTLPPGTLSGTVTTVSSAPIAGATVAISGGYSTVTDGTGHYSINLASGHYNVTVTKYGYVTATVTDLVVIGNVTTTQDFALTALANSTISGVVRDASTSWPLYARINIAGYPGGPVFTNPVTGAYSVVLANGVYTFTVTAMSGGYTASSQPVTVSSSATRNFPLAVDIGACSAPGYQSVVVTTLLTDGFDTSTAPAFSADWTQVDLSGTAGNWATSTATVHPSGVPPHSAPNLAYFNSWSTASGEKTFLYRPNGIDLSGQTGAYVSFWMYHDTGYASYNDTVQVYASTDGSTFYAVGSVISRYTGATGWARHAVDISAYTGAGKTNVRIGFVGTSQFGNDIHIDDLNISNAPPCAPIATGGLVIGAVIDANSGAAISDATVKDAGNNPATMIDSSADHARPARMYVIGQPSGVRTLTATAPAYRTGQVSPTVVAGGTVLQNFQLAAGKFSVTPASLSFTVTKSAPTATKTLSLANNGGITADYRIYAITGVYTPPLATGPFAENPAKDGPKNTNVADVATLPINPLPTETATLIGGDVSKTINVAGLETLWGIGFNTDAGDFWLGGLDDDRDYRFTTGGVMTGDTIDIAPWAFSTYGADMTYNPFTKKLWQVNWGGDNCIYELDPAAKTSTGNKICPPFGNPQHGLAFDPVTNTYYSGSWYDRIINHFAPDGTLLDSKSTGLNISGLAINPVTGHLFVLTNVPSGYPLYLDVYVLDTRNSYSSLGGFDLKSGGVEAFVNGGQGGLEMDCSGNLWAVDYIAKKVYVASSGETGACGWKANWLSVNPSSGNLAAGGHVSLTAGVNGAAVPEGTHNGYFRIENSSPYGSVIVPVTLTVKSKLTVTRSGTGSGTVISSPAGINCGADCTEEYQPNSVVTLSAAAATYSTFTRWSGNSDCVDGIVTMSTSKSCNAVFTITPIRIPDQYTTIQAAYNALLANGSIQSQIRTYPEQVKFNRPITAILSGGYIPNWTAATGMTTIQGSLTIEKGTAIVSNLIIK
jgi:hypothetical protein